MEMLPPKIEPPSDGTKKWKLSEKRLQKFVFSSCKFMDTASLNKTEYMVSTGTRGLNIKDTRSPNSNATRAQTVRLLGAQTVRILGAQTVRILGAQTVRILGPKQQGY
jgi:hypothetical protein